MSAAKEVLLGLLPVGPDGLSPDKANGWIDAFGTARWDAFIDQAARDSSSSQPQQAFRKAIAAKIAAKIATVQ